MSSVNRMKHFSSWLTGLGIVLLFLGYRGIRYIPMTEEEKERQEVLEEVMMPIINEVVQQSDAETKKHAKMMQDEIKKQSIREQRTPPYWNLGVASSVVGGLFLLTGLGIWFRDRPERGWIRDNDDV